MGTELIYAVVGIVAIAGGFFLGIYIQNLRTGTNERIWKEREHRLSSSAATMEERLKESLKTKAKLEIHLAKEETKFNNLEEKLQEQKKNEEMLQEKFENLANKILHEKSETFTQKNKENIENILNPLNQKIKEFEEKVEKSQKENISIHSALKQQLLNLQNQNLKITQEAENLTKALKGDNKMQGNWGELVLERVLEKSGLEKDREYSVQKSFVREDGSRVMPDVIIHLPDGKKMIVDSKVSLIDYERYINAGEEERPRFLKDHINSLRKHVEQLSAKKYEDLYQMESPDFVLMFVPIEPAFALAINEDNSLYNKAFGQNIVIVTPATLLATLRTIDTMWNNEKQQKNAIEIARQAGALYDKFEGFVTDLTRVGKKMDEAKNEYRGAMNKLVEGRGNIVTSIEKLKKMGAKAKKTIPEPILKRAQENNYEEAGL